MKILVLSDTHGHMERVINLLPRLTDLDYVIHLGDFLRDGERLRGMTLVPVITVGGNCDGVTSKEEAMKTLETPFGKILITHGHLHGAKRGFERLLYQAQESECKAVLFGHTHTPFYGVFDGIALVNPGSISLPRNESKGTYAILTIDEVGIQCALVPYREPIEEKQDSTTTKKPPDKKHPVGFLRNLFNNSDRF